MGILRHSKIICVETGTVEIKHGWTRMKIRRDEHLDEHRSSNIAECRWDHATPNRCLSVSIRVK